MLGPFATASRRIAIHQVSLLSHAATVACRLRIDVHNNNDNAWQRGLLWRHRMGPIIVTCFKHVFALLYCKRTSEINPAMSNLLSFSNVNSRTSGMPWANKQDRPLGQHPFCFQSRHILYSPLNDLCLWPLRTSNHFLLALSWTASKS